MRGKIKKSLLVLLPLFIVVAILLSLFIPVGGLTITPSGRLSFSLDILRVYADPGWLSGWDYRRVNSITGSSDGNQTNYQMRFNVHYSEYPPGNLSPTEDFNSNKDSGNPIITYGTGWEENGAFRCAVLYEEGEFKVWYGGWDEGGTPFYQVGFATVSLNLSVVTKDPGNPVLNADDDVPWLSGASSVLGEVSIIRANSSVLVMAFTGNTTEVTWGNIGIAVNTNASDYNDWTFEANATLVGDSVGNPGLIYDDVSDILYMFYSKYPAGDREIWYTESSYDPLSPMSFSWSSPAQVIDEEGWDVGAEGITDWVPYYAEGAERWEVGVRARPENQVYFWYSANLTNGGSWNYIGNPIETGSGWELSRTLGGRAAIDTESGYMDYTINGTYYFWYDGYNSGTVKAQTGVATGDDQYDGTDVYLDEKCQTDFDDIRFTSSDGSTELDYWLETKIDSTNATFWVEVPSILSDSYPDTQIYLYYGNSTVSSDINGDNTFLLFDHFDDSSLNTSKWGENWSGGSYNETGTALAVTGGASAWEEIGSDNKWSYPRGVEMRAYVDSDTTAWWVAFDHRCDGASTQDRMLLGTHTLGTKKYRNYNDGSLTEVTRTSTLTSYTLISLLWSSGNAKFYENHSLKRDSTANVPDADMGPAFWAYGSGRTLYIDWVAVRNYTLNEPAGGVWGSEEAICSPDISNTPSSKDFGTVSESTDYWSDGSEPSWPLDDGECYFTITNNSGGDVSITIVATNFIGGVGWTLTSGAPGENTVRVRAGKSGDVNEAAMVILTTSPQAFISALADSATKKWEIKLETGTFTDPVEKSSTITLSATCD